MNQNPCPIPIKDCKYVHVLPILMFMMIKFTSTLEVADLVNQVLIYFFMKLSTILTSHESHGTWYVTSVIQNHMKLIIDLNLTPQLEIRQEIPYNFNQFLHVTSNINIIDLWFQWELSMWKLYIWSIPTFLWKYIAICCNIDWVITLVIQWFPIIGGYCNANDIMCLVWLNLIIIISLTFDLGFLSSKPFNDCKHSM